MSKKQAISANWISRLYVSFRQDCLSGSWENSSIGVNKHLERDLELLFIILEFIKIWHSFNMVINISEYKRYQSITVFGWMWKEYLRQQCMSGL
jgi:hypothetical protein